MGYSPDDSMVRVDYFAPSGKWKYTEAVRWLTYWGSPEPVSGTPMVRKYLLTLDAFYEALCAVGYHKGMTAVCLEPYCEHSFPLMLPEWNKYPQRLLSYYKECTGKGEPINPRVVTFYQNLVDSIMDSAYYNQELFDLYVDLLHKKDPKCP